MFGSTKKLAQNAIIYSFFTLLQRGLGFFLLPVYTTVLAKEQLGIISTSTAIISFLVILFGLSLRGSTAYFFYKYKDTDLEYLKKVFGTNVSFILLFSSIGIALLLLTKSVILDNLFLNIDFNPYVLLALISVFLQPLYFFYQSILKAKQHARKAASLDLVYFGSMVSFTLILILVFGFEAEGALLAYSIASMIVFIISIAGLSKEITICLKTDILKKTLKYSLPILPHNLSGWAMNMIDRILLNSISSLSIVALFDVGSQIGKVVNMVSLGVNSAYSPWFFDQVRNDVNSKKNIAKITNKIVLLYVMIAILISWMAPEILVLISKPDYYESWKIVPIIATAFVLNGFYFTFSNTFFLEKTKYLPILSITGAVVNIGLNIYLIPKFGLFGAAIASILTKVIFATITYIVSQRLYAIPYELTFIISIIIIGFIISCLPYFFQPKLKDYDTWMIVVGKSILLGFLAIPILLKNLGAIKNILKR